ncbi:MAG TPA: efflux RND transporter periplasmic adaptor subunit [Pedobacter sp.]|jgi:RND family efflux transporter MFP subunit
MIHKLFLVLFLSISISGCRLNQTDTKSTDEELESLAYTLYTDKTELFVEFKPLVVGTESKFAAHLTKLGDTFKPLTEGRITVSLIVNKKGLRNTVNGASSPGIFRLALSPVKAGKGKLVFDIVTKDYTDKIVINDVIIYPDLKTALANQKEEAPVGEISYLKEQAWKVEFANTPITRGTYYQSIKASGTLIGATGDEVSLVASTPGVVKFASSQNAIGVRVGAGQTLFTISGGGAIDNNLDVAIRTARSELAKAREDYRRATELIKDQLITRSEFSEARLRYQNAQSQLSSLSKNYSAAGRRITAPISGYIKNIMVTEGAFVEMGQPLAIVGKNQKLLLKADVSQQYFTQLRQVKEANFLTAATGERLFNTRDLNGRLISVGQTAANSPYVSVTFEINNPGNLVSGSVADVFLKSSPIANAISVPKTSLIEEQGTFYVYVQTAGESFQKREVTLGSSDGETALILTGLTEGERVVTKGANQIKLATMSGAVPAHGHEH